MPLSSPIRFTAKLGLEVELRPRAQGGSITIRYRDLAQLDALRAADRLRPRSPRGRHGRPGRVPERRTGRVDVAGPGHRVRRQAQLWRTQVPGSGKQPVGADQLVSTGARERKFGVEQVLLGRPGPRAVSVAPAPPLAPDHRVSPGEACTCASSASIAARAVWRASQAVTASWRAADPLPIELQPTLLELLLGPRDWDFSETAVQQRDAEHEFAR